MKTMLTKRTSRQKAFWLRREWEGLTGSIVIAVLAAAVGLEINFPERLTVFFGPHGTDTKVLFLVNFLVVWLIVLLVVSYRRWRSAALRNQELEDIVDSINPDVLLVVDANRTILMANMTTSRMFGYDLEEVLTKKTDFLYFDRRTASDRKREIYDALEREGFHVGTATGRRKNGQTFPLEIITGLLKQHGGSVLLLRDITERKKAEDVLLEREAQLRQSQKMEALGLLAGGVAHDFNNLLTSILGFGNLALNSIPAEHPARRDIEEVVRAGEHAAKLTAQLLAMGRKQPLQIRPVDLNGVVHGVANMLRRLLGEDVALTLDLSPGLGNVKGDPGGLEQVLLNLAVNARDAMPKGGRLRISTSVVQVSADRCKMHGDAVAGAYGCLAVRDSGSGMTPEVKEHLFEPFFTTKDVGKGTGLGLSTVYGIIRQCGGFIEVESEISKGAEFRVFLPLGEASAEGSNPAQAEDLPRGSETILLVEDEPGVRGFASRVLGELGYRIIEASESETALELCARTKSPVHLILTDVVLPGLGGYELVDRARRVRSDFKVMYVTGFDREASEQRGESLLRDDVLPKPYSAAQLARRVRQALDSPS